VTATAFAKWVPEVERCLADLLPPATQEPARLHEAMRYSVMAGGKRIRPVMAMAAYEACGGNKPAEVLPAAVALELLHTYSLIHDDLPAMDNDDLRRGKPTSHVVFGEALAILAGDALLTLGAELLVTRPKGATYLAKRSKAARMIFRALGTQGMAGGQALDLAAEGAGDVKIEELAKIHRMKTGAFLEACLLAGGIWAGARSESLAALKRYGAAVGMAFQVVDDILDATQTKETMGKTPGKDAKTGKATFVKAWGIDGARRHADRLLSEALRALSPLGDSSFALRELAHFVVDRDR
jgi:geranylgeranyl pyrophosphate synthase